MLRRTWAIAVLLALLAACGGGNDETPEPGSFGAPATDGQFTFTVHSFECGAAEVSRGLQRVEARATFCLLEVTIENTGDEGRRYLAEPQRLIDEAGTEHPASVEGSLVINPDRPDEELAPGDSLRTLIVFDVLNPTSITSARLRDGVFSEGVVVPVRP